jgi:hypothetical protein
VGKGKEVKNTRSFRTVGDTVVQRGMKVMIELFFVSKK